MTDYSWIKVPKYVDDPTETWQERYEALARHHQNETRFLINECEVLRRQVGVAQSLTDEMRSKLEAAQEQLLRIDRSNDAKRGHLLSPLEPGKPFAAVQQGGVSTSSGQAPKLDGAYVWTDAATGQRRVRVDGVVYVPASETGPLVTLREAAEDAYKAWIETDDPHNSADLRTAMAVLCDVLDGAHVPRKVETARASETGGEGHG